MVRSVVSLWEAVTSLTGLKSNKIRAIYMRLYGRDILLGPGKVYEECAATGWFQTLQYRSDLFGAVAPSLRRITKACDLGSTPCRTTVVVSM